MLKFDVVETEGRIKCSKCVSDVDVILARYPVELLWEDLRYRMAEEIYKRVARRGKYIVLKIEERTRPSLDYFCGTEFEVIADLKETNEQIVYTMKTFPLMEHLREACPYCGSYSPDDARGNCIACGGVRGQ